MQGSITDRSTVSLIGRMFFFTNRISVVLTVVGMASIATTSHAQLRSGRTTRTFYAADSETDSMRTSSAERSGVVRAEYTPPSRSEPILETDAVITASCSDCDAIGPGLSSFESYGAPIAGGCGCDECSNGATYGEIAPTCMSTCAPSCRPLLSLWCRLQVRTEVPLYWRRAAAPPALITTSPAGTGSAVAGRLGLATTSTLLGDARLNEDSTAGFRISLATWLGPAKRFGLMFRYWNAGDQDDTYGFSSNDNAILARPFFNTTVANSFAQDTQLIAFPGDSIGSVNVSTSSSVEGLEFMLRRLLYQDRFTRIDWLYGYQHVGIDEGLSIMSSTTVTGNVPALQGSSIAVSDRFETQNDFNGVSYGLLSSRSFACWKMETMFRLGAGNLRRKVNIIGSTVTTSAAGATNSESQGLLARNTNNQPFVDDTFVVIPEVGINFAYYIRPGFDFTIGYNYLMIPNIAQASQQIDDNLAVNLSDPLTGELDPQLDFDERRYWLHSLGFGFQLRY